MKEYIDRINNIQWEKIGTNKDPKIKYLGYEYLRRLAKFYKDTNTKVYPPMCSSIIAAITNNIKLNESKKFVDTYCNEPAKKAMYCKSGMRAIIEYYLQLAEYSITHPETKKYLDVYEPLIRLLEIGGDYILKNTGLEIRYGGMYPLGNWYERFVDADEIDISEFY